MGKGVNVMKERNKRQRKSQEAAKKTAYNNQWTNANLKYYPDERERKDGPGGD